jgi:predicted amidohydrolase
MTAKEVGRPVRVVSLSFRNGRSLEEIVERVDREAAEGADLVVLPETWLGQGSDPERVDGATITAMATVARRHRTYIVCPIDRTDGERRLNSAVVLDRDGGVIAVYDKVYPYWSEFRLDPPVTPGSTPLVVPTDFGNLGMAICFDVNFPEVWHQLADQGAELVVWPSAYSAGTTLQAHVLMHHYALVTATQTGDCQVFDITGERVLDEQGEGGVTVSRVTLDLDRAIFHENFNLDKREQLLNDHGDDVVLEQVLPREQWFVLRAARPDVSARDLARRYGLEELPNYVARSRREIDRLRDGQLAGHAH